MFKLSVSNMLTLSEGKANSKTGKKNTTPAGVPVTFLGQNVAIGVKVEDQIMLGKMLVLVGSTGTVCSQKDTVYGANLEVHLREADYPIGQEQSSFALSLKIWRGDLAVGANLQSQISVGRNSNIDVRAALNNKMSGRLQYRLAALIIYRLLLLVSCQLQLLSTKNSGLELRVRTTPSY